MKPFFIAAALSLGLFSCSESAPAVQITQIKLPDASCSVDTEAPGIASGQLNFEYGRSYVLAFLVNNSYSATPISVGDNPLEPDGVEGGAATAFVTTLRLSYDTTPSLSIPDAEVPYAGGLNPSSQGNVLVTGLLTSEASGILSEATKGGDVQVRVTVQFAGEYGSGSKEFETNEIVYTINAIRRNFGVADCKAGEVPEPGAPCGSPGGQDGNLPSCKVPQP
ncbi:hypothetical protein JYK02_01770 [Corallococcus macrosporus]|uniref:Lipoprotein n=1 Tax=Corallococcus macrosporus TaxID=35 RepID=A0ABS3D6H2_9BACT|nr:hypothetical protein [Corallococcus macrosporus]MBN8226232.1 hypothetical protein [Corallococcus macrosporus]